MELVVFGACGQTGDLADYLVALAAVPSAVGQSVIVSTVENTPSVWQLIRREAGSRPPNPEEARR
ncbi:hypothetical protein [Mycobacterium angelicum]|uniref:Uncharacterized protein n=1 Tax=Mycobacterium angelicum TaxID=470074 RepID=A0A1W9ZH18_MYCAN|nr:hypothetical protein [Mycobacterium angelicum]MCV7195663.1 hypothetical protein [Mycobacterium angelicum]ORA15141.1 hypothetical protein BST12_22180 [Mycobacterium angelicum]